MLNQLKNKAHDRQESHKEIRNIMKKGELEYALLKTKETLEQYGLHIGLLCEKAGCEYELGLFQECEETFILMEKELVEAQFLLSRESLIKTYIMLSKFAEEFGEIEKALKYLLQAREISLDTQEKKWSYLQELRILSFSGQTENLSEKYLSVEERNMNPENLEIETLHSLMWTEWKLFGWNHAEVRFNELLKKDLNILDQRLVARDFLELSLISEKNSKASVIKAAHILSEVDLLEFDAALLELHLVEDFDQAKESPRKLSKMMRLRLILLSIQKSKDPELKSELKQKYLFILQSLSKKSREILTCLLRFQDSGDLNLIVLNTQEKAIEFRGSFCKLTKLQFQLLSFFSSRRQASLDDLSIALWKTPNQAGHYDRIRMLIYRTNSLLEKRSGSKFFEVTKNQVLLSQKSQIR
jgi:hypothetical protein